jgi:hypothetical protein
VTKSMIKFSGDCCGYVTKVTKSMIQFSGDFCGYVTKICRADFLDGMEKTMDEDS